MILLKSGWLEVEHLDANLFDADSNMCCKLQAPIVHFKLCRFFHK